MEMKTPEKFKFPQNSQEILGANHNMKDLNEFFFRFKKTI